jgi:hypothetical protein
VPVKGVDFAESSWFVVEGLFVARLLDVHPVFIFAVDLISNTILKSRLSFSDVFSPPEHPIRVSVV